jgi:hypothetical protein
LGKNPKVAVVVKSNTAEAAGLFPLLFMAICAFVVATKPNIIRAIPKEVVFFMISYFLFVFYRFMF